MHELTAKFLEKIKSAKSKKEVEEFLFDSHLIVKEQLSKEGLKFFSEGSDFSEDIIGGQILVGEKNVYYAHYYEEINFIKYGVTREWYSHLDRYDRYNQIRKQFDNIYSNLN